MKKIIAFLALALVTSACQDFEEFQTDPNRATETHPSMLLTQVEVSSFNVVNAGAGLASRMLVYTQTSADDQYYGWQRAGFGRYGILRQVTKMEEEAERLGLKNYQHLATFLRCYNIIELTKVFGDIPYSQALKGESEKILTPAYDTQESIYLAVLDALKTAGTSLDASAETITGDVIYNGDILKWKKAINSFTLRLLISLSKKTANTQLKIVDRFNEIVSDPDTYPVFTSNSDNLQLPFYNLKGNYYPYFNSNSFKTDYYLEESFVDLLKQSNDPRLVVFARKAPDFENLPDDDLAAYYGLKGSAPLADNSSKVINGEASAIDPRYYNDPVNEPSVALGYAEVEFSLAEAAARGWISQSEAETHYDNGVMASLSFFKISATEQAEYLQNPDVAYDQSNAIEMIVTQKYINFFMNGGWEPFYNHLRTGFPSFDVSGGGILNDGKVPKRWMYPQDELQVNATHVTEAIQRQYPQGDDINGAMWLLRDE